ncbi:hypothetical protein [Mycolicibacterium sp. XJ870]
MFTELFVPRGAHSRAELERLAHRLTAHGMHDDPQAFSEPDAERADPGVLDFLESITHVVVHEVDVWVAGGRRRDPTEPPRYVVRVYVPGPWRKPLSEYLIGRITRTLAEADADSGRVYRQPHAEVHVLGVPEGSYGVFGRVVSDSVLTDMISDAVRGFGEVPDGMAVDPVCGATVRVNDSVAFTAEVGGSTYGFCCPGCRRTFLDRHQGTAADA